MRFLLYTLMLGFMLFSQDGMAQQDSLKLVEYKPGFRFREGIYLSHQQITTNKPIPLSRIITKHNKSDFDFFEKLLNEEKVHYFDKYGLRKEIEVVQIKGFCRRGSIYINWGDDFSRITVVGNICHFVSSVTVVEEQPFYNSYNYNYYNAPTSTSRTELRQYIMNFTTGKIVNYNYENVLLFLMPDAELYDEFNGLKKKKKKQMKFLYIRKFNEKHKLYIPIN